MTMPDDITVRVIDLPVGVGGYMSEAPDGHVDVYINARHGRDQQMRSYRHELRHIENDDLHNDDDIVTVETRADGHDAKRHQLPKLLRAVDLLPPPPPPRKKINWSKVKRIKIPERWDIPWDIRESDFF